MSGPSGARKCHVLKKESEEFEFFLKADELRGGQIITSVTKDGPAYRGGLKDGDRIISINGNNVESKSHEEIVSIIRECVPTNEITFSVVDSEKDPNTPKPKPQKTSSSSGGDARPRICKIKKKDNSFGFFLEAHGDTAPGHFIKQVTKGGAADGTSLRAGDRLIAVGKNNVEKEKHAQVVNLIKKAGPKVTLLVIDEESYKELKAKKIPITEKLAKSGSVKSKQSTKAPPASKTKQSVKQESPKVSDNPLKGKTRVVHVLKNPKNGYGFFLKAKKGSPGEFVGNVDKDGSAEICGLYPEDQVMAVNGKSIIGMEHADVIGLIKAKQSQVVFVVMDTQAMKHFEEKANYPTADDISKAHSHLIRSVEMTKGDSGFGMFLKMEKGCSFHIFSDIETNGVADKAGLKDGDILISVNGSGVWTDTHEQCIGKIKSAGSTVSMIVGSRATSEFLQKINVTIGKELYDEWPTEDDLKVPDFEKPSKPVAVVAEAVIEKKDGNKNDLGLGMKPRLCQVVRQDGGFGFFLKDDKGHYLINLEKNGPAFRAGALDYDRIVEINGVNVENEPHSTVVQKIRDSGNEVTFLLVNKQEEKFFQEKGVPITSALLETSGELDDEHKPRVCTLIKTSSGYGFHLMAQTKGEGELIKEIVPGGAAEIGGLRNGDRIIEVNGSNVVGESHEQIVKRITANKEEVTFLVIDKEGDIYYKLRNIVIVAALAKKTFDKQDSERESIGRTSATSSVIETEATVHQEDEDKEDAEQIAAGVAAAAAVIQVLDDHDDERDETKVDEEETIQDKIEEVIEVINEEREEINEPENREFSPEEKAAMAVAVATAVEEIREEINEESGETDRSETASAISEAIEIVQERKEEQVDTREEVVEDEIEDILEDIEDRRNEDEGLGLAEKVVVAAVVTKVVDNRDEIESASSGSRPTTPTVDEPPVPIVQDILEEVKNDDVQDIIENHIEEKHEEEDEISRAAKAAAALIVANEISERLSEKDDSDKEEEPEPIMKALQEPPPVVIEQQPSPVEVREPPKVVETPKATFVVIPKVAVNEKPQQQEKPSPVPIAAILTQTNEEPKPLKPTPQPQTTQVVFGRHQLKSINRPPVKSSADVPVVNNQNEDDQQTPAISSVAALRAAIEKKNRENQQQPFRKTDARNELAQLSKSQSNATNKHSHLFGASVKKPQQNGTTPKKQWTGEGMTIKIIET
uniref:multiple PDZ domain protein-like n=1 Tax=Styela clava TaxID=7725 RepID=UPI00193ACA82|nr:multiple PDZ domain protein-like [Styela clava]